jgi:hypothetical protein
MIEMDEQLKLLFPHMQPTYYTIKLAPWQDFNPWGAIFLCIGNLHPKKTHPAVNREVFYKKRL